MKKILVVLLLLITQNAFALYVAPQDANAVAGFSVLSDVEKAEIQAQIARKIEASKQQKQQSEANANVDTLEKWANLGPAVGRGIAETAKELGVVANDFVNTRVGFLTAALIVWKVIGADLVHLLSALAIWVIGISVTWALFNRMNPWTITYHEGLTWYGSRKVKSITRDSLSGEVVAWMYACFAVIMFCGWFALSTI